MPDAPRLAVLAGTFDPLTFGHLDLITRSRSLFDRVTVAVLVNPGKTPLFTVDERVAMVREATADLPGVSVDAFGGLLTEYVRQHGAVAIVRGLRGASEFADEQPMALMNRHLHPGCETIFILPSADRMHISSRLVREIASLGGSLDGLVPTGIAARLARRFDTGGRR
jgi:pantetheine-phosphate adenylyltransferase